MSRIPVPSSSPSNPRNLAPSPVPFPPDRSSSPVPRHNTRSSTNSVSMSSVSFGGSLSETRKKQSKRDEAIRKKIESELARKRAISTTQGQGQRTRKGKPSAAKGTVAALKPTPALTVPENITVAEASQLCAAKRTDCVLVVDDEEGLSGIFTAKDLAYRVTAEGLDPHVTPVHQIMTRNPMVTRDTTSATEALQLMVSRHFRHLPVCNEDGNVVGLLDITKVFHEALGKVERSSVASEQLFSAMAGVQSELGSVGSNPQAAAMLAWAERLREKTALPDLTTVMDSRTQPATVGPKTTVREVAKLMKERRTTAVCVMEGSNPASPGLTSGTRIAGIFTSKDVVLRVIAAGLDAGRCSVVRVMTPHPDTAPPVMSIHEALKKMHNGHYLNLPVVEEDGRLVAIVDVLTLTYATLEQMNAVNSESVAPEVEGGPMWSRFFDSIGHEDSESLVSGSRQGISEIRSFPPLNDLIQQSPHSEVHPDDSASVVDDEPVSALGGYPNQKAGAAPSVAGPLPADDGTYVFKFRTPSGRTHRFQARHDDVDHLRDIVGGKLATDPFFTDFQGESDIRPDPMDFHLSYTDADGDTVLVTSDSDVTDAVKIARQAGTDRVVLFVQGGKGWEEAGKKEVKAAQVIAAARKEVQEIEKAESVIAEPPKYTPPPLAPLPLQEEVFGIPKDLLLPASIGALAVAIITVFTISRLTSSNY
ncbi:CBS domain-containing protein CBSCBSPB3 [Hypsizygus marmoreus]|uniref:CBS domain-containing protein CBSCBSPB3 n=1 Tax=Hypsizygus marmoreus TaxID=39966 RepID=A0A369KB35_HYPMA|nr:CBS domain-containing protein CBSCBSPB3 [Hypsizygus marmoreus]